MCAIEAQLENMLGTFHCRMKGETSSSLVKHQDCQTVAVIGTTPSSYLIFQLVPYTRLHCGLHL